jgi:hypothetical protein
VFAALVGAEVCEFPFFPWLCSLGWFLCFFHFPPARNRCNA